MQNGPVHHPWVSPTRRTFLRGLAGLSAGALVPVTTAWHASAQALDYSTREAFDHLDLSFNDGNGYKEETNDDESSGLSGKVAWGEAYALHAYALMYATYRDTRYIDTMVDHIDHVLANRDSERGVTDHAGQSQPAWRANHHYTVGYVELPDSSGRPVLEVRSALAYADETTVTVSSGSAAGTFRLDVHNSFYGRTTTHDNLSMDPASSDYAVDRVLSGFRFESPARVLVTVRDLRDSPSGDAEIPVGDYRLVSRPYVFEAHTGQIALPLAIFARMVQEDPRLSSVPLYRDRAEVYAEAAELAVAVHDAEWRENDEGEGYYVTLPDAPVWHAGMDNPFNHFLALGRAIAELAVVTGDPHYARRAVKLARTLANDVRLDDGGAYIWPYWWSKGAAYRGWDVDDPVSEYRPWYPPNTSIEDTSHAQIDVNFALQVFRSTSALRSRSAPPFTGQDMERFAATFTQNVATRADDGLATVHRYVDGSGDTGLEAFERMAAAWSGLASWDSTVLDHSLEIFDRGHVVLLPSTLYCVAWLNRAANRS